ncbi:4-diphosphocytidyl-2-C-methyl-D-erythritol kinase [Ketogulonicigenium robustum]|uniref:4-diphosphocytidyl-2-C-methyl-D-erythritol kinase n=1 Tax=Ketogulonicigenium robustum TaxID=92947 RepID=A0A1W6NWZ1_9RHOB|nr:4-(cytidine 5'-diphospho)-2-C-methyl-D-erythritol kinase [Ketogulonicigenium robustum]ARO13735.1 4-diphosphocytidyl-2-C-methyl-D-erythritol kinase [Ketogulonicigenium robustum]
MLKRFFSFLRRRGAPAEPLVVPNAARPVAAPVPLQEFAPAKLNLALHVTGQRPDGYHLLDSIVAFASIGDEITVIPAQTLSLTIIGPFAHRVPAGADNLVLRAAETLRRVRNVDKGGAIKLNKLLPTAAGLGGGSADAAAALRLLARYWQVEPLPADHPEVLALGADVPVCLGAPTPQRMQGIGEDIAPLQGIMRCGLVLVNPMVELATPDVFAALTQKDNAPISQIAPAAGDFESQVAWLAGLRNDLQSSAESLAPEVTDALETLRRTPGIAHVAMSGSGATCIGFARDMGVARNAARSIQITKQNWWVSPAQLLS